MASAARRVLVVGDGCVGTYAATTIAARHPRASVVLKSRCGTTSDKTVVDSLCSSAGVRRLESFAALRGGAQRAFDAVIVATKTCELCCDTYPFVVPAVHLVTYTQTTTRRRRRSCSGRA